MAPGDTAVGREEVGRVGEASADAGKFPGGLVQFPSTDAGMFPGRGIETASTDTGPEAIGGVEASSGHAAGLVRASRMNDPCLSGRLSLSDVQDD